MVRARSWPTQARACDLCLTLKESLGSRRVAIPPAWPKRQRRGGGWCLVPHEGSRERMENGGGARPPSMETNQPIIRLVHASTHSQHLHSLSTERTGGHRDRRLTNRRRTRSENADKRATGRQIDGRSDRATVTHRSIRKESFFEFSKTHTTNWFHQDLSKVAPR